MWLLITFGEKLYRIKFKIIQKLFSVIPIFFRFFRYKKIVGRIIHIIHIYFQVD